MEAKKLAASAMGRQQETNALVQELVAESEKVEEQIKTGENEIFHKNEEAFFMAQDERELIALKQKQTAEVAELRAVQEQKITDIKKRKMSKKFTRQTQRDIKELHLKTHDQEEAYKITNDVKRPLQTTEKELKCWSPTLKLATLSRSSSLQTRKNAELKTQRHY